MPLSAGKGKKKAVLFKEQLQGSPPRAPPCEEPGQPRAGQGKCKTRRPAAVLLNAAPHGTSGSPRLGEGAPWVPSLRGHPAAQGGTSRIRQGAASAAPRLARLQSKAEGEGEPSLLSQAGIPEVARGWMQPKDFFRQHRVFSGGISCCRII